MSGTDRTPEAEESARHPAPEVERLVALLEGRPALQAERNGSGVWVRCPACEAQRGHHVVPRGGHHARVVAEDCTCEGAANPLARSAGRDQIAEHVAELLRRPKIYLLPSVETGDLVDQMVRSLAEGNVPPRLFVRGGRLVRVVRDENDAPHIDALDSNDAMTGVLIDALSFVRESVTKGADGKDVLREKFVEPPGYAPRAIRTRGAWPGFPALEAIVGIPVLRADGTIHDTPGYDEVSRMLYAPDPGLVVPAVPDLPTRTETEAAVALIGDVLADFPFVGEADRGNAFALLLTPFIRGLVDVVPLTLISSPKPGTGKGLLTSVVATIATGSPLAALQLPDEEAELRKTITATLHAGATFVWFDDVRVLRGTALTTALTTPTWGDRKLGETTRLEIPQRATWIASGNNVEIAGDLARRTVRVKLDPHTARPYERDGWKHPDLRRHVAAHRGELIAAALTLARAWVAAGRPVADVPVLGTFETWAATVGGILAHAGIDGFLGNVRETWNEAAVDENAWEIFLGHVLLHTKGAKFTASELTAGDGHALDWNAAEEILPDELAGRLGDKGFARVLGKALRKHTGTMFGDHGIHVVAVGKNRKDATLWRVVTSTEIP